MKKFFRVFVLLVVLISLVSCNAELNPDKVLGGETCEVLILLEGGSDYRHYVIKGSTVPADFLYANGYLDDVSEATKAIEGQPKSTDIVEIIFSGVKKVEGSVPVEEAVSANKYAFRDCTNLKKVTFDDSIEVIEQYAFNTADKLEEVYLANVKKIGTKAFYSTGAVDKSKTFTKVKIDSEVFPELGEDVFGESGTLSTRHISLAVDKDLEESYKELFKDDVVNPSEVTLTYVLPKEKDDYTLDYEDLQTITEITEDKRPIGNTAVNLRDFKNISLKDNENYNLYGYEIIGWAYSAEDALAGKIIDAENTEELYEHRFSADVNIYAVLKPRTLKVIITNLTAGGANLTLDVVYRSTITDLLTEKPDENHKVYVNNALVDAEFAGILTEDDKLILEYKDNEWKVASPTDLNYIDENGHWLQGKDENCELKANWTANVGLEVLFHMIEDGASIDFALASNTDIFGSNPPTPTNLWDETLDKPTIDTLDSGSNSYKSKYKLGMIWNNLPVPSYQYYVFKGWYEAYDEVEKTYANKKTSISADVYNNFDLYAKWEPAEHTVKYMEDAKNPAKDVSGDSITGTYVEKDGLTKTDLPTNAVKKGYVLVGWMTNTDLDNVIESVPAGEKTEDFALYAKWKAETYKLTYTDMLDDPFTGNWNDQTPPTSATYDTNTDIPVPVRAGYKFEGWYTDPSCKTPVNKVSDVYRLVNVDLGEDGEEYKLYAKWELKKFNLSYKNKGNNPLDAIQFEGKEPKVAYYGILTLIPNAKRTGYKFMGWYKGIDCTPTDILPKETETGHFYLEETDFASEDVTLYADWKVETYKLTYSDLGNEAFTGNWSATPTDIAVFGTNTDIAPKPTREGYTFDGWYYDAAGTKKVNSNESGYFISSTEDLGDDETTVTLYAKWKVENYNLVYADFDGKTFTGKFEGEAPTKATYGTRVDLLNPTKVGFHFVGWHKSTSTDLLPKDTNTDLFYIESIDLGDNDDTATLYAEWRAIEVKVLVNDELRSKLNYNYADGFSLQKALGNELKLFGVEYTIGEGEESAIYMDVYSYVTSSDLWYKNGLEFVDEEGKAILTITDLPYTEGDNDGNVEFYAKLVGPSEQAINFYICEPEDSSALSKADYTQATVPQFEGYCWNLPELPSDIIRINVGGVPTEFYFYGWFKMTSTPADLDDIESAVNEGTATEITSYDLFAKEDGTINLYGYWTEYSEGEDYGEFDPPTGGAHLWYNPSMSGTIKTLAANTPFKVASKPTRTKTGYVFNGWEFHRVTGWDKYKGEYIISSTVEKLTASDNKQLVDGPTNTDLGSYSGYIAKPGASVSLSKPIGKYSFMGIINWKPITYKVIYKNTAGQGATTSPTEVTYDTSYTVEDAPSDFKKYGMKFAGWIISSTDIPEEYKGKKLGKGQSIMNLASVQDKEVVFEAQWVNDDGIAVTLNMNFGDKIVDTPLTGYVTYGGDYTKLRHPEVSGGFTLPTTNLDSNRNLAGWYMVLTDAESTKSEYNGVIENLYDKNGKPYYYVSTNTDIPVLTTATTSGVLAKGIKIDVTTEAKTKVTLGRDHELIAQWKYDITFAYNGATGNNSKISINTAVGTKYSELSLPTPTLDNYKFTGWYRQTVKVGQVTSSDLEEVLYKPNGTSYGYYGMSVTVSGSDLTVAGDQTLVAQWEGYKYKLTYTDLATGTDLSGAPTEGTYGIRVDLPSQEGIEWFLGDGTKVPYDKNTKKYYLEKPSGLKADGSTVIILSGKKPQE